MGNDKRFNEVRLARTRPALPSSRFQPCREGVHLVVTANGKRKFVMIKSSRPKMTRKLAEARAVGDTDAPSFNVTAFLASPKK
jgi:hypothetical protein